MPRAPGQEKTAVRTAWLPQFFDQTCDPMMVRTAYRCRAYPDEQQQAVLNRTFGCVRVVWNRTLAARHARWHAERTGISYAETDRALTAMKKDPDLAFLSDVSSVPLQQALRHQHKAFTRVLRQARPLPPVQVPPRPPVRALHPVGVLPARRRAAAGQDGRDAAIRLVVAGGGRDRAEPGHGDRPREPDGRWYVTFTIEASDPEPLQRPDVPSASTSA